MTEFLAGLAVWLILGLVGYSLYRLSYWQFVRVYRGQLLEELGTFQTIFLILWGPFSIAVYLVLNIFIFIDEINASNMYRRP